MNNCVLLLLLLLLLFDPIIYGLSIIPKFSAIDEFTRSPHHRFGLYLYVQRIFKNLKASPVDHYRHPDVIPQPFLGRC